MEEEIWSRLQAEGHRRTAARSRLLNALLRDRHWRTPQELDRLLAEEGEAVGLTTVYRFLELLVREGFGHAYLGPDGMVRYGLCSPSHHHHAVCLGCGEVTEIACTSSYQAPPGFEVTDHDLAVYGLCRECREKRRA